MRLLPVTGNMSKGLGLRVYGGEYEDSCNDVPSS